MDVEECPPSENNFLMNYREDDGNTILHLVIETENYKCLKALVRYASHLDFR